MEQNTERPGRMQDYPEAHQQNFQNNAQNFGILGLTQGLPINYSILFLQNNGQSTVMPTEMQAAPMKQVRILDRNGANMYVQQ